MSTATDLYEVEAKSGAMKGDVTNSSDTTDLGSGVDVAVFIAKTATNKQQIVNALEAVKQKIIEEDAT